MAAKGKQRDFFWVLLLVGIVAVSAVAWFLGKWGGAQLVKRQNGPARQSAAVAKEQPEPGGTWETKATEEERASRIGEVRQMPKPELPPFDEETETGGEPEGEDEDSQDLFEMEGATAGEDGDELLTDDGEGPPEAPQETAPREESAEAPAPAAAGSGGPLYRLQVGMFTRRENALRVKNDLEQNYQIPVFIAEVDLDGQKRFRVQAGAFRNRDNAEKMARELRVRGHHTYIWKEK